MKTLLLSFLSLLALASLSGASDQIPAPPQSRTIALVGATIHPVTSAPIENGMIIFSKGKIVAIGKNVPIPPDARVVDVAGKDIYPGLIDAYSMIGLIEIESVRGTVDIAESGLINPNVRAEVAVNPGSEVIPVTRANGITTALVVPRGGTISGRSALMMMDGWTWEDMTLKAPVALHVNWPRMTPVHAWWMRQSDEEQKKQRDQALKALEQAFDDARAYMTAKYAERQSGVPFHQSDLRWEAMIPALERKMPVVISADEIQQIEAAIAFAEKEKINIIIWGGEDAWRVADLLEARKIPVIVSGTHNLPSRRFDDYDTPFTLPDKLFRAGVSFCIGIGGASNERNLPYQAATASAYGLPKEEALKAITLYPAQIFGVADRIGSLEIGKDATLIVTTGDPLETFTQVVQEFIMGKEIDLSSRHTMLYEKYKKKYEQLRKK